MRKRENEEPRVAEKDIVEQQYEKEDRKRREKCQARKESKEKEKRGGKDQGNLHEHKLTIQYKILNSNKGKEND